MNSPYFEKHHTKIIIHGLLAIYFTYALLQEMARGFEHIRWFSFILYLMMAISSFCLVLTYWRNTQTWLFTLTETGLTYSPQAIYHETNDTSLDNLGSIAWRDLASCEIEQSLFLKKTFLVCTLRSDQTQKLKLRLSPFTKQQRETIIQNIQKHIQAA